MVSRQPRWIPGMLLAAALFAAGCGRQRQKQPLIDGFLFKELIDGFGSYDRWIEVWDTDGLPQIPTATLNGRQLELIGFNLRHTIYEDTLEFKTDTSYQMDVGHYWGSARARIAMPADFLMTRPESGFVLLPDSGLAVVWQKSRGASWYWLNFYLQYVYTDSLGETLGFGLQQDTFLYGDTVCAYEPARLFPGDVRQILWGEGDAAMWAADGPQTVQGAENNIEGDGYGYYSSANQPLDAYFVVGNPPAVPMNRAELVREIRRGFVSRLRQMTGITDTLVSRRHPGQ
jgi:hypothetical protein